MTNNIPMMVLRSLLSKRGWHGFNHLVKVDTFESNEYRTLYQHLARLHEATDGDITIEALRADVDISYSHAPQRAEEMSMVLDRLDEVTEEQPDLMESLIRRFIERSGAYEIAQHIAQTADQPSFTFATVADIVARTVEVGERVSQDISYLFTSPLSGAPDNRRTAVSLGLSSQLDSGLRGGVAGGELVVIVAPPARGKTSLLCRAGASHTAGGGRVLHVTCEINRRKVFERYDQCWTALDRDQIETPDGQKAVSLAREVVAAAGGHVWVVDWSYLTVTAGDVGALFRRMKGSRCGDGMLGDNDCQCGMLRLVDMIVIDYLQLMSPSKVPGKEMRQAFSAVVREHRGLARNLEVPLLTAWQINRAGSDATLLSMKDVAESWDLPQVADIMIGLNQTPAQLENRRMVLNIVKQREGTSRGAYEVYCDLDKMVVRDLTHEDQVEQVQAIVNSVRGLA